MPEFDFLVPATINGQPTTINRVIEVFANARLPIGCDYFFSNMVEKYGDIPVEKSYWARHTWTVVQMHEKGKGINRVHKLIETIIFQFLCCQVGIESGYGRVPFTLSQCLETHTVAGKEWPIYAGGFKKPVPGAAGVLVVVGSYGFIGRDGGELMLELVTQWFALMEEIHNALPANNRRLNHPAAVGGF